MILERQRYDFLQTVNRIFLTLPRLSDIFFLHYCLVLKKYYFCIGFSFGKLRGGKGRYEVWK